MNRSCLCATAVALALLLAAAPAAAAAPADRAPRDLGGGWLAVMAGWVRDLLGEPQRGDARPEARAERNAGKPGEPPSEGVGEPPQSSESDGGPDWDPGG